MLAPAMKASVRPSRSPGLWDLSSCRICPAAASPARRGPPTVTSTPHSARARTFRSATAPFLSSRSTRRGKWLRRSRVGVVDDVAPAPSQSATRSSEHPRSGLTQQGGPFAQRPPPSHRAGPKSQLHAPLSDSCKPTTDAKGSAPHLARIVLEATQQRSQTDCHRGHREHRDRTTPQTTGTRESLPSVSPPPAGKLCVYPPRRALCGRSCCPLSQASRARNRAPCRSGL